MFQEIDDDWEKKLRVQKFSWHNSEWLSLISSRNNDGSDVNDDDAFEESQMVIHKKREQTPKPTVEMSDDEDDDTADLGIGSSNALLSF